MSQQAHRLSAYEEEPYFVESDERDRGVFFLSFPFFPKNRHIVAVTCNFVFQFSDEHPKETEELWSVLCSCWPNNLKVIIRYLLIISGMAPQELLPYVSTLCLYGM